MGSLVLKVLTTPSEFSKRYSYFAKMNIFSWLSRIEIHGSTYGIHTCLEVLILSFIMPINPGRLDRSLRDYKNLKHMGLPQGCRHSSEFGSTPTGQRDEISLYIPPSIDAPYACRMVSATSRASENFAFLRISAMFCMRN